MQFNQAEKTYLRTLRDSPIWLGILRQIAEFHSPRHYHPNKGETGENEFRRWIYESGRQDAIQGIMTILNGSENSKP